MPHFQKEEKEGGEGISVHARTTARQQTCRRTNEIGKAELSGQSKVHVSKEQGESVRWLGNFPAYLICNSFVRISPHVSRFVIYLTSIMSLISIVS